MYCTPEKFRVGGFGVDLTDLEDFELRSILNRATAMVNQFCAVPMYPSQHDFRGGSIVDEQKDWDTGTALTQGSRRFYPLHLPLREVDLFRIYVTNQQYVEFPATGLYVTYDSVEVISLAYSQVGIFGAGLLPNIGLFRPKAKVSYTYGYLMQIVGEQLEQTDALLFRAQNQWWAATPVPVVYVNGSVVTTGFTLDYDEGTVLFASGEVDVGDVVKIDYTHRLPSAIAEATAVIAADLIGERELLSKGLYGLSSLAVGEVRIARSSGSGTKLKEGFNPRAEEMLEPFIFQTVAGGSY